MSPAFNDYLSYVASLFLALCNPFPFLKKSVLSSHLSYAAIDF
jgi:hypothetical protein